MSSDQPERLSQAGEDQAPGELKGALARRPGVQAALLGLLCAVLFLPRLGSLPLADPDEARCAIIVQHMIQSGRWVVPYCSGRPYLDKPAPYFWLAAAGQYLTGDLELGGRLVSACFAALAVLAAFALAQRAGGYPAGLIAGTVLATAAAFLVVARLYRMDMPFVALMWLALCWFWRYERPSGPRPGEAWKRWLGFYALCAGATLVKGPAGLGLPGLVVAAYLLLSGRWRRVFGIFHLPGIGLYLLLIAPWYAAMALRVPGYAYEFLVVQHLFRYADESFSDKGFPGIYYVGIVLGGMMPWSIYLPGAIVRDFPRRWRLRAERPAVLFCWLAALLPLAFFMSSRTKLEVYVLPVGPPLAVLLALPLARWVTSGRPDKLYHAGTVAMRLAVAAMLVVLGVVEYLEGWLDAWIVVPAAGLLGLVVLMSRAARRERRGAFVACAAGAACVTLLFGTFHTAAYGLAYRSRRALGLAVRGRLTPDALLCYFGKRRYSFPLYAGRTDAVRFVRDLPGDRAKLVEALRSRRKVFCLVEGEGSLRELENGCGFRLTVIAREDRFLCATNLDGATRPAGT